MARKADMNVLRLGVLAFTYSSANGQCARYEVEILAGLDCQIVWSQAAATGISELGELCGSYSDCNEGGFGAVWLGQGPWTALPVPLNVTGILPADINSSRQMAATVAETANPVNPRAAYFDFKSGTLVILGVLPGGNFSESHAINEGGVVCGYSLNTSTGPLRAFIWQNKRMSALNLPLLPHSVAYDIAETGAVCGWMGNTPEEGGHGFIWLNGQTTDLGIVLEGALGADARGISSNGQVVCGFSVFHNPAPTRFAFVWHDGVGENLGILSGYDHDRSIAYAVNDDQVAVGHSSNAALVGHAFVWRNGVMTALNDLIPPALNLDIFGVPSINNAGQIASEASILKDNSIPTGDRVAVRLTPMSPPPGDCDCNGQINIDDLLGVINQWGPAIPTTTADFNNDGLVSVEDLMEVLRRWSA